MAWTKLLAKHVTLLLIREHNRYCNASKGGIKLRKWQAETHQPYSPWLDKQTHDARAVNQKSTERIARCSKEVFQWLNQGLLA
jgi:hypothetical protein